MRERSGLAFRHIRDDGSCANNEPLDCDELVCVAWVEVAHVNGGITDERADFVHDIEGVAVFHRLSLDKLFHSIGEALIQHRNDFLGELDKCIVQLARRRVGLQVNQVEVELVLISNEHAVEVSLVDQPFSIGRADNGASRNASFTIKDSTVFGLEVTQKVGKCMEDFIVGDCATPGETFNGVICGWESLGRECWVGGRGGAAGKRDTFIVAWG